MKDEPITKKDIRRFKAVVIEWWTRRPVYSFIDGKIIGYIKLERD